MNVALVSHHSADHLSHLSVVHVAGVASCDSLSTPSSSRGECGLPYIIHVGVYLYVDPQHHPGSRAIQTAVSGHGHRYDSGYG